MNQTQQIQDAIMALKAQLQGKRLELAMLRGDRRRAQHHKARMYAVIRARQAFRIDVAEKAGECLFDAAGEADRMAMDGFAHG